MIRCVHCGFEIEVAPGGVLGKHIAGPEPGLGRCQNPDKPYGYNAHPVGTPCPYPCLGEVQPDPNPVVER